MKPRIEKQQQVAKSVERVEQLAQQSDENKHAVDLARGVAGRLWPEVCWSALPCIEAGAPMRQALETGLYEWDLALDPLEQGA